MKTRTSSIWIPALVLLAAWLPGVLAQNETNRSSTSAPKAAPFLMPVRAATNSIPPATPVLPKIRLTPWTTEIVKLAKAGVEDNVMLSFIDNSGMFNLGADQIIYLSDLGVSGQVICEMLRHDAEVIAGVRPLTIASELPRDPSMQITFTASSSASVNASTLPSTIASAPPGPVNSQLAGVPNQQPLPEHNTGVTDSGASVLEFAMMGDSEPFGSEVQSQQRRSNGEKSLYPVREPYPVPLTAPIIFVQMAERTPDTIVIEWFPQSDER